MPMRHRHTNQWLNLLSDKIVAGVVVLLFNFNAITRRLGIWTFGILRNKAKDVAVAEIQRILYTINPYNSIIALRLSSGRCPLIGALLNSCALGYLRFNLFVEFYFNNLVLSLLPIIWLVFIFNRELELAFMRWDTNIWMTRRACILGWKNCTRTQTLLKSDWSRATLENCSNINFTKILTFNDYWPAHLISTLKHYLII